MSENTTTPELEVDESPGTGSDLSAASCSLLEWASEELLKAECLTYPIADTGDYSSVWRVQDCGGKLGWGLTLGDAILDVRKSEYDKTKWDYIPKDFAENASG